MSEKIDFEEELGNREEFNRDSVLEWVKDIAQRVEEQTIQRCYRILMTEKGGIERLYATPEGQLETVNKCFGDGDKEAFMKRYAEHQAKIGELEKELLDWKSSYKHQFMKYSGQELKLNTQLEKSRLQIQAQMETIRELVEKIKKVLPSLGERFMEREELEESISKAEKLLK